MSIPGADCNVLIPTTYLQYYLLQTIWYPWIFVPWYYHHSFVPGSLSRTIHDQSHGADHLLRRTPLETARLHQSTPSQSPPQTCHIFSGLHRKKRKQPQTFICQPMSAKMSADSAKLRQCFSAANTRGVWRSPLKFCEHRRTNKSLRSPHLAFDGDQKKCGKSAADSCLVDSDGRLAVSSGVRLCDQLITAKILRLITNNSRKPPRAGDQLTPRKNKYAATTL